jgi:hypothetical protein
MNSGSDFYISELYNLSNYSFQRTRLDSDWDQFVERSPHGTIYSSSDFLIATEHRLGLWKCFKKNQPIGLIVTGETQDGSGTCHIPQAVYSGLIAAPHSKDTVSAHAYSESFRFTAAALNHLCKTYKVVTLKTSPFFQDIRPFLWHNYGSDLAKFELDLRYTSFIDLRGGGISIPLTENPIYLRCSKSRRQEIRYSYRDNLRLEQTNSIHTFLELYKKTFLRQKIQVSNDELDTIKRILGALDSSGKLIMWGTYTSENELANLCVFGLDSKRCYYLYGASEPKYRDSAAGTYGLFQSMNNLAEIGYSQIDLEGVNSPKRGHFKLSFGGSLDQYYELSLNNADTK